MDTSPPLYLSVLLILVLLYLFLTLVLVIRRAMDKSSKILSRRLDQLALGALLPVDGVADIVKKHEMSGLRWLDVLLSRHEWSRRMDKTLDQAGIDAPLGIFVLLSLVFAVSGYLIVRLLFKNELFALGGGAMLATLPFTYIRIKKRRRMAAFEAQLPEGLDLVARALKAGHTFSSGMNMVVSEFADPIRGEFQTTLEEINFGVGVGTALDNLMERVDSPDLSFFVISVKIQSETGGNLAEIIEGISSLIRERFKLRGRIRALSAEGRMSAWVLCMLPPGVSLFVHLVNPEYFDAMLTNPIGRMLLYLVAGMMVMGILVMRKMIRIEV